MRNSAAARIIALLTVVLLSIPGVAWAQSRQTYAAAFTSVAPGSPTGLRQEIRYVDPDDPGGKPHAVQSIVFTLPDGARIDTSVPARCNASEVELQLLGADACPAQTKVGTGALSADLGIGAGPLPRIVETDVTFFNAADELILFAESTNTAGPPVRVASRIEVRERSLISRVPPLPGAPPPDPFLAIKDVFNDLEAIATGRGGSRRAYITTPPSCPESGHWIISATFSYRDGLSQTVESPTPCAGDHAGAAHGDAREGAERRPRDDAARRGPAGRRRSARFPRGGVEAGESGPSSDRAEGLRLGAGGALVLLGALGLLTRRRRA